MKKKWNWKTTLSGFSAIVGGVTLIIVKGNMMDGVTAIITGVGLIFAKDFNVTGGGN